MTLPIHHLMDPTLAGRGWWDSWDYPVTIHDQHFGIGIADSDLKPPTLFRGYILRPRTQAFIESSGKSEVKNEKDKLEIMLNVQHFNGEEIDVKVVDRFIVVHGKHKEKSDEYGFIRREFTRRYALPVGAEAEDVQSSLSLNGVLTITVPKKIEQPPNVRVVPITMAKLEDQ